MFVKSAASFLAHSLESFIVLFFTTKVSTLSSVEEGKALFRSLNEANYHVICVFGILKVFSKEATETKDKGLKPDILDRSEVAALRSSTQVIGKEVQQTELRLHSAQQKLRDLNMNIR